MLNWKGSELCFESLLQNDHAHEEKLLIRGDDKCMFVEFFVRENIISPMLLNNSDLFKQTSNMNPLAKITFRFLYLPCLDFPSYIYQLSKCTASRLNNLEACL